MHSPCGSVFLVVALGFLFFVFDSSAFNLEPRIPVVKKGPEKSHFGYAVALHKSLIQGSPRNVKQKYKSWLLVGAPKGENLQPNTNRSGALFRCPLTSYTSDCEQVLTDGLKGTDGSISPPTQNEIKDDQWMGVTVKSQGVGGYILVCAHRYQRKGPSDSYRWGYGLCYRLTDNFEYEDNYQPCLGKPVQYGHEQFGYCQAGTSGVIMDGEVVLGLPGTYTWRGTVYRTNISSDYLRRDKTQYLGVYTEEESPVDKYSNLGYSVAVGKFFGDKVSYVAGAPRSRDTGQVIFFSKEKIGKKLMPYDLILNGEKLGSSYGFEVLAVDINGDNLDDLIVSAPFYFTPFVSGAVYIYLNDGTGISNETPFTRLEGAPDESRFGFSMASLGDLNHDGFNDIAIGAPYEGNGVIYIYLGSKDGISREPAQIIRAEDLPGVDFDAFGYSLSGGLDMDNNGYNDLLTSSFCSDKIVLLRARPIIDIVTKVQPLAALEDIDPTRPGCPADPASPDTCFTFEACFKMRKDTSTNTFLQLKYSITEQMYNDQSIPRIRFHDALDDSPSTVERYVQLEPENEREFQCSEEVVYLKRDNPDLLRPVKFKLTYSAIIEEPKPVQEGRELPDVDLYPILNQQEAVKEFEASFAKDCLTNICQSDLVVESEIDLPDENDDGIYTLELGKQEFFTLYLNVTNKGEPAYKSNLYIVHDKAVDLSQRESVIEPYECVPSQNAMIQCELGHPFVNATGEIRLVFKPSGFPFKSKMMTLAIKANSTSAEVNPADNRASYDIEVKRRAEISISGSAEPEQVFYSGDVVGESAIETLEEIGTEVNHKYLVDNQGPWKVDKMQVRIWWPYQVENNREEGKWLLYLTDVPTVDRDGECDIDPKHINPLGLESEYISVYDEVETGSYRGVTPSTVVTSTKKSTKITTHKKVHTSKTKVTSSFSSSSSSETGTSEGSYGSGGTRTHVRVSRKTFDGDKHQRRPTSPRKDDEYDYQTYDSYFDKKEKASPGSNFVEEDIDGARSSGHHRKETTFTRKISNSGNSDFSPDFNGMNDIQDIRKVKEGGHTYINVYSKDGKLVWSSRGTDDGFSTSPGSESVGGRRVYKEYSHSTHSSGTGGSGYQGMGLEYASEFSPTMKGDEMWINGFDKRGKLVWSVPFGSNKAFDHGNRGTGTSYHSEYSYKQTYNPKEGKKFEEKWSTSDGDKGSRTWTSSGNSEHTDIDDVSGGSEDRDRFNWDFPDNSQGAHRNQGGRWSQSGGFRTKSTHSGSSTSSQGVPNYTDSGNQNYHYYKKTTHRKSSKSYQDGDGNDDTYHGNTYSRTVFDDDTGDAKVFSKRVFTKDGEELQDVRGGPFEDSWVYEDTRTLKRTKREREMIIKPQAITDSKSGKIMQVVNFRCDGAVPTAKCFTFTCTIRNLAADQAASIRIPSRLWNSTLIEDYPRVSYVSIRSNAELMLPEEIRVDQDTSDDFASAETLAYSNLLEQLPPEEVPLWVILVSVLAGLLLLVLIAIVLWKLGFFKRRRPDPTLSGNLKNR